MAGLSPGQLAVVKGAAATGASLWALGNLGALFDFHNSTELSGLSGAFARLSQTVLAMQTPANVAVIVLLVLLVAVLQMLKTQGELAERMHQELSARNALAMRNTLPPHDTPHQTPVVHLVQSEAAPSTIPREALAPPEMTVVTPPAPTPAETPIARVPSPVNVSATPTHASMQSEPEARRRSLPPPQTPGASAAPTPSAAAAPTPVSAAAMPPVEVDEVAVTPARATPSTSLVSIATPPASASAAAAGPNAFPSAPVPNYPCPVTDNDIFIECELISGAAVGTSFRVGREPAIIGRPNVRANIYIADQTVSHEHCQIWYNEQTKVFCLKDVGSTHGTYVKARSTVERWVFLGNRTKQQPSRNTGYELTMGTLVKCGDAQFEVRRINVGSAELEPLAAPRGTQPYSIQLRVVKGTDQSNRFILPPNSMCKVGRLKTTPDPGDAQHFFIRDNSKLVSANHAEVAWDQFNNCFTLRDVSTNGTFTWSPGTPCQWTRLEKYIPTPIHINDLIRLATGTYLRVLPQNATDSQITAAEIIPNALLLEQAFSFESGPVPSSSSRSAARVAPAVHVSAEQMRQAEQRVTDFQKRFGPVIEEIRKNPRPIIPEEFLDPISLDIMSDPVITCDGQTYERLTIQRWLNDNTTSPKTNIVLESRALTTNYSLRSAIETWLTTYQANAESEAAASAAAAAAAASAAATPTATPSRSRTATAPTTPASPAQPSSSRRRSTMTDDNAPPPRSRGAHLPALNTTGTPGTAPVASAASPTTIITPSQVQQAGILGVALNATPSTQRRSTADRDERVPRRGGDQSPTGDLRLPPPPLSEDLNASGATVHASPSPVVGARRHHSSSRPAVVVVGSGSTGGAGSGGSTAQPSPARPSPTAAPKSPEVAAWDQTVLNESLDSLPDNDGTNTSGAPTPSTSHGSKHRKHRTPSGANLAQQRLARRDGENTDSVSTDINSDRSDKSEDDARGADSSRASSVRSVDISSKLREQELALGEARRARSGVRGDSDSDWDDRP